MQTIIYRTQELKSLISSLIVSSHCILSLIFVLPILHIPNFVLWVSIYNRLYNLMYLDMVINYNLMVLIQFYKLGMQFLVLRSFLVNTSSKSLDLRLYVRLKMLKSSKYYYKLNLVAILLIKCCCVKIKQKFLCHSTQNLYQNFKLYELNRLNNYLFLGLNHS